VISGNTVFNNRGCGIQINADGSDGGVGVSQGMVVSGNRIYNNAQGVGAAINFDGVQNSIIQCNLIYNAQRNGIALYQIDGNGPSSGDKIVNNTIIQNGNGPSGYAAIQAISGAVNTTILNNVLSSQEMSLEIDPSSQVALVSDYNAFGASGIDPTGQSYANNISLAAWQAMGLDKHSIYIGSSVAVDALYRNVAAGDFHLNPSGAGPLVGTGEIVAGVTPTVDFYGSPLGSMPMYIGAAWSVELSGTPTPPPVTQAPLANADSYSVQSGQALTVSAPGVLANDTDPNGLALAAVLASAPAHGTLALASNGGFTYSPASGFVGSDSFTYSATDGKATSSAATVMITVTAPPVATKSPSAPVNLQAKTLRWSSIGLSWQNTATNTTSIQIERQGANGIWQIIATLPATATGYIDNTVLPTQGYYYQVRACNAAGNSQWCLRAWTWG